MTRQSTYLLLFVALSFIGGTVQGEGNWQVVNAANPPSARIGHGMATLPDGRVVLFGGEDDAQNMYNDLFSYESEQWSPVTATDFTPAQRRNQVVWFHDGALYIHGGVAKNHEMLEDLWAFDLAKQKWEEMQTGTTKPFARYGHVATPLPDGGVVFSGGTDVAGFALKDTWKLNPDMTYTLLGFSPHPMSNHVAQVIDNVLYTFPEPGKIDTLDLTTNTWGEMEGGPPLWGSGTSALGVNQAGEKIIYFFGGIAQNGFESDVVYEYNTTTHVLSQREERMPFPYTFGSCATMPPMAGSSNLNVLFFGGISNAYYINTTFMVSIEQGQPAGIPEFHLFTGDEIHLPFKARR